LTSGEAMSPQEFWTSITLMDLLAPVGGTALILGGAAMIASSIPMRAELIGRRVNFAVPQRAVALAEAEEESQTAIHRVQTLAGNLSQSEQRVIVLFCEKFPAAARFAIPVFVAVRVLVALVFGALIAAAAGRSGTLAASPLLRGTVAIGGMVAGWMLPVLVIRIWGARRTKAVAQGLPDALELLVVCVEAGISLEDGLRRVAEEIAGAQPELADELVLTWAEINILPNRAQALSNLAERIEDPGVRSVASLLAQSMRLGTPLVQSLRSGASELRNDQMMRLEEQASKLPAMLTIPVMLFIMPTIFLIIGGPAVLRIIDLFLGGAR
jgi:tight adherence protein C